MKAVPPTQRRITGMMGGKGTKKGICQTWELVLVQHATFGTLIFL